MTTMGDRLITTGRERLAEALHVAWMELARSETEASPLDHCHYLALRAIDSGAVRIIDPADPQWLDALSFWCGICVGGRCDDCELVRRQRLRAVLG